MGQLEICRGGTGERGVGQLETCRGGTGERGGSAGDL